MEPEDQARVFSPEERAALVAAAQAWEGTQAEFAAKHGIHQSTVSKWLSAAAAATWRTETDARKAEVIERARTWTGTQRELARAMGLGSGTVSRWLSGDARSRRHRHATLVLRRPAPTPAPTMLEVVRTPAVPEPEPPPPEATRTGIRLMLGDRVGLVFDTLPPASWVAELAVELRRC
jgi:transposase-like protein